MTSEAFIEAGVWHGSLERAEAMLAADPEVGSRSIHTAAVLGDEKAVLRFLALDRGNATAKADPYGADALVYLCLSKYLRLDQTRSDRFVRAAQALLDAGADPNSGFWTKGEHPEFETALYGAAGVAHHADLTRLLLERGADPNDEEAVYHSPETRDNRAMRLLVETGKLTADNLALMLIRKHDWHDYDGVQFLLAQGIDVNRERPRGWRALHHAIARDNHLEIIDLLLTNGADPMLRDKGESAAAMAARRGRGDLLQSFERRGIPLELRGVEQLIAACARNDAAAVRAIADREPGLVSEVVSDGGRLLAQFAGVGNTEGVRLLLDLGVSVSAVFKEGDGYFGVAKDSMALHVAAWRASHATVKILIARGAQVNVPDGKGRTPLSLAVKACVDSFWMYRRSPESVEALLRAGASVDGVAFPSGYAAVDELLSKG